ncbi:MAG: DUF4214 domain-containing protein [Acidimicrobiales bacterium]
MGMASWRSGGRALLGAVAAAAAVSSAAVLVGGPPAVAAPTTPVRRAEAPHPNALPLRPAGWARARELLLRLHPGQEPTERDVVLVAGDVDRSKPSEAAYYAMLQSGWIQDRIDADYQRYLGRAVDPSGLEHWDAVVNRALGSYASGDIEQVTATIAASAEAWRRSGSTNAGFVDRTYEKALGRAADPSGRAYWIARLDAGTSRQVLVRSLLRSRERAVRLVGDAYVQYLGRPADPAGRASWVARYTAPQVGEVRLAMTMLGSSESVGGGCDPLDPRMCLLPFPNDRFTVPDATTATGRRVAFKREWLPANKDGVRPDPSELNRNDGFSPGQAGLLQVPGIDLAKTGAATLDDIGASLDGDAPILAIDADTGERWPIFAELDANIPAADQAKDQLLYLRPAKDWLAGHRYIFALRNLKDGAGGTIPARSSFTFYRDGDAGQGVGDAEARRPHVEQIFGELADAGIAKDDLYLAWDFTVASTENTTGRLLHIRNAALASLKGGAPAFHVDKVTNAPAQGVARRVEGTFQVPLYLTGDGSPGHAFNNGPDGLPRRNGTFTADFDCELPTLDPGERARGVIYGHGLFGDLGEVRSGPQRSMVDRFDMAYCATTWIGMSEGDIGNAATILKDVSTFPTLADRSQQGILDTIFLGRLMTNAAGFTSDDAFQTAGGDPILDTSDLFYDGNSQGGIIGGAFVATSPDVSAGVLGVTGMNYSTLLERSVDFDPFRDLMKVSYPKAVDRVLGLQVLQMLWDRGEANGYAAHLTDDPLPGTPAHRVLLHVALGDHQVAPFTAEIEARTAGMGVHRPMYGPGRSFDVDPGWGLPSLSYPSTGSGLVVWDSGSPVAPLENVPPRAGADPHEDPRRAVNGQEQKDAFLRSGGTLVDVCSASPCTAPAT